MKRPESLQQLPAGIDSDGNPVYQACCREEELWHLLNVAGSITRDAAVAWGALWKELRECTSQSGCILPEASKGFVPTCGWPEFLEKFWELKHYLDSAARICKNAPAPRA